MTIQRRTPIVATPFFKSGTGESYAPRINTPFQETYSG
jgi:hypothetical protein